MSRNYIFIHPPKTGGHSVRRSINPSGIHVSDNPNEEPIYHRDPIGSSGFINGEHVRLFKGGLHTPYKDISDEIGKDVIKSCYTFGFVRNPWDRILSFYKFSTWGSDSFNTNETVRSIFQIPFEYWLTQGMETHLDDEFDMWNQLSWFKDEKGNIAANDIFKLEDIDEVWKDLQDRLSGLDELIKINESNTIDNFKVVYKDGENIAVQENPNFVPDGGAQIAKRYVIHATIAHLFSAKVLYKEIELLPKKRDKVNGKEYTLYYSDRMIDMVHERCKEDIEYFGYEFGE